MITVVASRSYDSSDFHASGINCLTDVFMIIVVTGRLIVVASLVPVVTLSLLLLCRVLLICYHYGRSPNTNKFSDCSLLRHYCLLVMLLLLRRLLLLLIFLSLWQVA